MLLIEGDTGKSIIIELIHKNTNALTFVYYNQPVVDGGLWINSDTMEFGEFVIEVDRYIEPMRSHEGCNYLIIYTNKSRKTVRNKKILFKEWEEKYGFNVIIGCR
jgi:hypothetical protein